MSEVKRSSRCIEKMVFLSDHDLCLLHNVLCRHLVRLYFMSNSRQLDLTDEIGDCEHLKNLFLRALTL